MNRRPKIGMAFFNLQPNRGCNMLRNYIQFLLFLLLITGIAASLVTQPETITIKNSVDMRNGPGSYYPLILRLQQGAEVSTIERQQQWLKVKIENETGWIPQRSAYTEEDHNKTSPDHDEVTPNARDAFDELAGGDADSSDNPYASPAQIAAAVKGFAKDFTSQKTTTQSTDLLNDFNNFVDPAAYRQFRNVRLQNWSWQEAQSRYKLEGNKASALDPKREQMGWGIANVIAQDGLVDNKPLQQYLTHIALVIAENSHSYETPVQVYILDSEEITGYAAPNGAIFVSKGILQLIKSEAEFAFFVAHELAHVVLSHGAKETERRKEKITAEQRFEELDRELGDREQKYDDTEEDLTQLANELYEYAIRDRLKEYEYEADYWATIYAYRAGYNPEGGLSLLQKIYDKQGDFENRIGLAKWRGTSLRNRVIKIDNQIDDLDIPQDFGHNFQTTFQRAVSRLSN